MYSDSLNLLHVPHALLSIQYTFLRSHSVVYILWNHSCRYGWISVLADVVKCVDQSRFRVHTVSVNLLILCNSNATSSNESILLFTVYLNCILLKYFLVSICKFCCTILYKFKELVLVHIIINLVYEVISWYKYVFTKILFYF